MDYSPKTEPTETRFSTPVSELDDHRQQPESLPRADSVSHARRPAGAHASGSTVPFPDLRITDDDMQAHNPRDFEQAIVEDDEDMQGHLAVPQLGNHRRISDRNGDRRMTVKLNRVDPSNASIKSAQSSRSTSPPNSVAAFADPRVVRARAGTITSRPGSDTGEDVPGNQSVYTHTRRPTFSGSAHPRDDDNCTHCTHRRDDEEDDVCMPPADDWAKTLPIDFEVLEEFIAERKEALTRQRHARTQTSFNSQGDAFVNIDPRTPELEHKLSDDSASLNEKASIRRNAPSTRRFTFFSSEQEAMVHASEIEDLIEPDVSFRDLFELPEQGGVWWLDCVNPTEDEIEALTKAFYVHPLTREDIMTQESREKVELFQKYYFVSFRSFNQLDKKDEDYLEPVNVYMVVFRTGVLSFTFAPCPHAANVIRRIGRLRDYVALSSDWICYAMIDDIVDSFGPVIREIEEETDGIEDNVFTARMEDFKALLQQIGECRRKDMVVLRLLGGKADVIKGFAKRCNEQYAVTPRGDIGLYLGDIQDHVVTMMSNLAHCEKMLSRSHANYLAQISVDQIQVGNKANEVLSKITLLASIIVPLNLVTGLFGMNVHVPGAGRDDLNWFAGIVSCLVAFVLISILVARRFKAI